MVVSICTLTHLYNTCIQGRIQGRGITRHAPPPKIGKKNSHEILPKLLRLAPLAVIISSAPPPLTLNPGSAPGISESSSDSVQTAHDHGTVPECCLTPNEKFLSYIMVQTSYIQ